MLFQFKMKLIKLEKYPLKKKKIMKKNEEDKELNKLLHLILSSKQKNMHIQTIKERLEIIPIKLWKDLKLLVRLLWLPAKSIQEDKKEKTNKRNDNYY